MEVAGLAIGIVGLYSTCRECYEFFSVVKVAEADSSAHLRELDIQHSILKAWGFHWQIQIEASSAPELSNADSKKTKLNAYLSSNRYKAEGVFKTFSALADTLSNQEKLTRRYGIHFKSDEIFLSSTNVQLAITETTIQDINPVITEVKRRLSILHKFKWALKDKSNFKRLIEDLRSHSESLYRLCPENAFESMNMYFALECLANQDSPAGLKWTSRLASQQAGSDEESSVHSGYKLLASAASLKASVNENRVREVDGTTVRGPPLEQPKMRYLGKGLALFENQVVYVEWRDYRGPPLPLTPEQEQRMQSRIRAQTTYNSLDASSTYRLNGGNQNYAVGGGNNVQEDADAIEIVRPFDPRLHALIMNFVSTFKGVNMKEIVNGLNIAGSIDHRDGEHKGFCSIMYKLPGTIGVQTRDRPAENLKLRAPVTLLSLLGSKYRKGVRSTLGARFALARKLVRAVCLLHSSGWLHKNIRAKSVMFFPEHVGALQEDRYETKVSIDISEPILMGYIFSRPDDVDQIVVQRGQPTASLPIALPDTEVERLSSYIRNPDGQTFTWHNPGGYKAPTRHSADTPGLSTMTFLPEANQATNIGGFTLDYYQHPAKHADPERLYRHAYDVYSLGILLLEIGLWEPLKDYQQSTSRNEPYPTYNQDELFSKDAEQDPFQQYDVEDHYQQRRWICQEYLERLRWACGDTYADVVLSCLMVDSSDDEVAKVSQRELCARIVADLERCQA